MKLPGSLRGRSAGTYIALVAVAYSLLGVYLSSKVESGNGDALALALLVAFLVTTAAIIVAGLVLGRAVSRQFSSLADAARAIASGELDTRLDPGVSAEMGGSANAFNEMAGSLQSLIEAASQERNRLLASLNSATDAILAIGGDGRVAFANSSAELLFERSQAELVGNPLAWVLPNKQVLDALRASAEDGRSETQLIERPNRRSLQVITAPVIGGGEWTALVVFHDMTEMSRVEQVRRDFIANVSHELRTPLASVKAVIETLRGGAMRDERVAADFLSRAETEVDRLVEIVEELLELSRIESGLAPMAQQPVDLGEVCARAVERLRAQAEKQGVKLQTEAATRLPNVTGDAERLERAVINLVHNAIKFTAPGGTVTVSTCLLDGRVAVSVTDTGVGIAPEDVPRIFERFYKADRARQGGGTGLGLAVVKHTAEAHGGTVALESTPGAGSTFTLILPATAASVRG